MIPTDVILLTLAELLAADPAYLAAAAAKHIHLIQAPFTPAGDTDFTTLTEATFDGYTALNAAAGAQQAFTDPITFERIVQLIEPVGGWHWEVTGVTDLPQDIYGFCVTDLADAVTLGSALLDTPITLTGEGQAVDLAQVRFTFVPAPLS